MPPYPAKALEVAVIMSLPFRWLTPLCCLALLFCPPAAFAEDREEEQELPDITVQAERINESTQDPPAFVEIIEMDRFQGRMISTEEAISQAAGVNVRSFGGLGATATVSVRGSSSEQVAVYVDGVRLNGTVGGGVDLSAIPAAQIARIEVIRGGASALYGEGAMGGAINIVTRKGSAQPRTTSSLAAGSTNTWQLAAGHSRGGETWDMLVGGSLLHSDGNYSFRNDNGTSLDESDDFTDTRINNELDARQLLLRGVWRPTARIDLAVHNDLYVSESGVPGIVTFPSPHVHQQKLRDLSMVSLALSGLGLSGLSLRTRAGFRYDWSKYRDGAGEQTGVPVTTERAEIEPSVEQRVLYAWGTHQLWTLLGEYRHTELDDEDFPVPQREAWAASLGDQVFLWGEILTLTGVIRYDAVSDVDEQWSPKGGLLCRPWSHLVLKGNVGRSFRAPNFTELYFDQGLVVGNPDLEPETSTHYDAGLQALWLPWIFVEGAYFRNEVRDLIEYLLIGGFRYKPFNIGRARLEGMELSLRAAPAEFLKLSGAYTLTYAIDTTGQRNRNDRQIPGRPRHVGFGRLDGRIDIFHPFVEYHYVGGNYLTQANTKLLPERELWNVGMIHHVKDTMRLGWEMKNLTDEQVVDVRGFPLPGRSLYLTWEAEF